MSSETVPVALRNSPKDSKDGRRLRADNSELGGAWKFTMMANGRSPTTPRAYPAEQSLNGCDEDEEGRSSMSQFPTGKKVAVLVATEGVEQIELTDPWDALVAEHAQPSIVSTEPGIIQAFNHLDKADVFDVDAVVETVKSSEYDALVLPRVVANPDFLRMNPEAVAIARRSPCLRFGLTCSSRMSLPQSQCRCCNRQGRVCSVAP